MKVTKYEHATVLVEKAGTRILIDPGTFLSAVDFPQLDAIVVTHEHPDHWTPDQLERLHAAHPDAVVYTPEGAAQAMTAAGVTATVTVVHAGDEVEVGGVTLTFFGGRHNEIHSSIPIIDNLGVLVDGELFHPGDSYTVPEVPVGTLAAPVGGPWLKIGEAMDYVLAVKPARAFPIHEMTLSVAGRGMHESRLEWAAEQGGGELIRLAPGESTDL
ncbi:MAG: MBL fold metallo-hydrolase [Actinomycetales bacterium]|nr:MBL fold metallo-hydrolase [Actinomycetales bacterium]